MEYYFHVWGGTPYLLLDRWDKIQRWVCRIFVRVLAASVESLAHCRNSSSKSFIYILVWQLFVVVYFHWKSTCYSNSLFDFFITILDVIRISIVTVCFLHSLFPRLDSRIFLPAEYCPLTFDLQDFKHRVYRQFLIFGLIAFFVIFLATQHGLQWLFRALYGVNFNQKK